MKNRLDKALVERGLLTTRSRAKDEILRGHVIVNGVAVIRPHTQVADTDRIELQTEQVYVGRGAYKLKGAVEYFQLDFGKKIVADFGASTGGFTQVALEQGAEKVFALDVGKDQLASRLKEDARVLDLSPVNLKDKFLLPSTIDIGLADLSYISLRLVLPNIFEHIRIDGGCLVLFKPQFEAGRENVPKDGVIKDRSLLRDMLLKFIYWCFEHRLEPVDFCASPVKGKMGNQEFFFWLKAGVKSDPKHVIERVEAVLEQ